jgi:hypothetical protein
MGLLEYQAMSSLRGVAHYAVLCTLDQPQTGASGVDRQGMQVAWTVHDSIHVQNHTLLGHSPPASQAGRRVGPDI